MSDKLDYSVYRELLYDIIKNISEEYNLVSEDNIETSIINYMLLGFDPGSFTRILLDHKNHTMLELWGSAHHGIRSHIPEFVIKVDVLGNMLKDVLSNGFSMDETDRYNLIDYLKKYKIKKTLKDL